MKVRLYRGPQDGKVLDLDPTETMVVTETLADELHMYDWNTDGTYPTVAPKTVRAHYRRTQHTHPDGSVYFEWTMPKGTKSGVKKKRKPKRQNGGYVISTGPYSIGTGTSITTGTINVPISLP